LPLSRAPRTVSLEKVRTFIDRNLTNPDLGVELICGELAVTRPSLYRAFAPVNGVASYIQHRRLEAAHSRLSETAGSVSMTEIAGEFCFSSSAHFSTAFRRRFGYSPRQAKRSPAKTAATRNLFWSWVEKLSPEDA
jgi:AraC-like DNA-binding protein